MAPDTIRILLGLLISVTFLVLWPRFIKLNAFFSLLAASFLFALIAGMPLSGAIENMQSGFGSLLQHIGIIVALGTVLGILLEKTGAMEVISSGLLSLFGPRRSLLAMAVVGALVGIPVFCDSGFIILSRLIPSLAMKTSESTGSLALVLSSSLYTTHSLIPPTPGPLAAAGAVGLSTQLGVVVLTGLLVSIPVVWVSYLYSKRFGNRIENIMALEKIEYVSKEIGWFRAFLPLMLPVLLIALDSMASLVLPAGILRSAITVLGIPIIALSIGIVLAASLIERKQSKVWPEWITHALKESGIIVLIIGAGGAFGSTIKASGLTSIITSFAADEKLSGLFFLLFAWVIAAIFKIAQGSTTSSMVITSSLMAPLAAVAGITSSWDSCLLVIVIGGGAMTVSHANDAYFWVVSQFGGISTRDAFRWYTPMTLLQGITTLIMCILLFLFL